MYFPSLSSDNSWLTNPTQIADAVTAHLFLSNHSQTQLYLGNVSSMAYAIQQGTGDILLTIELIRKMLINYYSRFFTQVEVEVSEYITTENSLSGNTSLSIYINFVGDDNKVLNVSKLLEIQNGKLINVINLLNTGRAN